MTRILSLDLATVTGWATHGGGVTTSGSQDFSRYMGCKTKPADHAGAPFLRFKRWLKIKIAEEKPEAIAYEEVRRWGGFSAAHCFGAYRGHMYALAAQHGIPCYGYSPSEVKKFWTGGGRAEKADMMAEARRRHPEIDLTDSNEADALAVLHLHLSRVSEKSSLLVP